MCEELDKLADKSPNVSVILLRFCVGGRLSFCLHSLSLHRGAHVADRNDRFTLSAAERIAHGVPAVINNPAKG